MSAGYGVAGMTGGMYFIADLFLHPTHFGGYTAEAIVTGALTGMISLALNFVAKKLFAHSRGNA